MGSLASESPQTHLAGATRFGHRTRLSARGVAVAAAHLAEVFSGGGSDQERKDTPSGLIL